jgi:signal transduction histidine kinase
LLAFVITVVAGFSSAMPGLIRDGVGAGTLAALILLGVDYCLVGTSGEDWCSRQPSRWTQWRYFAGQLPLAAAILYLAGASGFMAIIVFALVSQARQMLSRRLALLAYALILLTAGLIIYAVAGLAVALNSLPVMLAGLVFVAVFTEVALNERAARAEAERLAAELGAANRKRREYAAQVEELATTKERNRLAREIHDSLGHYLTVINVQLGAAQMLVYADPARAGDAVRKAQLLTRQRLADVRRSVAGLRAAPTSSRTLPAAVADLAEEARAAGIVTNLDVGGAPRTLTPQTEQALYHAAQEAFTNVRKHARASRADLTLDYVGGERIRLVIQGNGVGAGEPNGGFGQLGLREQVQLAGGSVSLRSTAGEGFRMEVEAPG